MTAQPLTATAESRPLEHLEATRRRGRAPVWGRLAFTVDGLVLAAACVATEIGAGAAGVGAPGAGNGGA
jgi:hypothetical protein